MITISKDILEDPELSKRVIKMTQLIVPVLNENSDLKMHINSIALIDGAVNISMQIK